MSHASATSLTNAVQNLSSLAYRFIWVTMSTCRTQFLHRFSKSLNMKWAWLWRDHDVRPIFQVDEWSKVSAKRRRAHSLDELDDGSRRKISSSSGWEWRCLSATGSSSTWFTSLQHGIWWSPTVSCMMCATWSSQVRWTVVLMGTSPRHQLILCPTTSLRSLSTYVLIYWKVSLPQCMFFIFVARWYISKTFFGSSSNWVGQLYEPVSALIVTSPHDQLSDLLSSYDVIFCCVNFTNSLHPTIWNPFFIGYSFTSLRAFCSSLFLVFWYCPP